MHLRPAALLASLTLFTAVALSPPVNATELAIPSIQYRQRTLPNGLQVISVEDHASPNVAVQMWYHVGSKDDPQGRSGFAHLFEHLMFKSTKHMHAEQMDRPVGVDMGHREGDDLVHLGLVGAERAADRAAEEGPLGRRRRRFGAEIGVDAAVDDAVGVRAVGVVR